MRTKAVLFFLLLLPVYVVNGQDDKREYLKKVLDNLEQIKSATYKVESEVWNPGMGHRTKRILRIERKEYQTY